MNNVETCERSLSQWFAMALVALLFASSGIVYAQKDKNKPAATAAPAKSAPAPAQAAHQAPPARSAPATHSAPPASRPAPTAAPNTGRPTPANQPGRTFGNQHVSPAAHQPGQPPMGNQPGRTFGSQPGNPVAHQPGQPQMGNQPGRTFGNQPGNPAPHQPGQPQMGNQPGRPTGVNQPGRPVDANRPGPRPEFHGSNGTSAHFSPSGRPTVVRTPGGATIVHAPSGARRIEVRRPDGRVIVTNTAGHGYVQRSVNVRGQAFVQRTYYAHGAAYPRFYRASVYRGITFNVYTPVRFYSPRFYAWGYSPWGAPVYYNFGFAASPWYGFYGGYFTPYPTYAAPNYWLTDYMLANSLQEGYQEHMDAAATAQGGYDPSGAPLSPYVKNLIAGEVQRQLVQESAESQSAAQNVMPASNAPPPILADNNPHVFVVSSSLIANTGSQECALTHGDVLQLNPAPSTDPSFANVVVLASKGQDCQAGNLVPVQLADLQEMQNHMRETVDQGLGELQTRQGQGGLPIIEVAMRSQSAAPYAADLPAAETNAANELRQQAQEADRQEQDVLGQAGPIAVPPASSGPVTIELGQTIADVVARMGNPVRIADLGQKKTYFYRDMKVIFVDGKVSDVQ